MNRQAFFDHFRGRNDVLGPTLDNDEVSGCEAILDAMAGTPLAWCAYALATAYHETAHTMQPIKEYGGPRYFTRMYDITGQRPNLARSMGNTTPGDGPKFCGRGYVQLTWRVNYIKAGLELGEPLESQPDLAMRPDIAARIMRQGMEKGWFTGKAFAHFLSGAVDRKAYLNSRRIINGLDKAGQIADYALKFEAALIKGGWA